MAALLLLQVENVNTFVNMTPTQSLSVAYKNKKQKYIELKLCLVIFFQYSILEITYVANDYPFSLHSISV